MMPLASCPLLAINLLGIAFTALTVLATFLFVGAVSERRVPLAVLSGIASVTTTTFGCVIGGVLELVLHEEVGLFDVPAQHLAVAPLWVTIALLVTIVAAEAVLFWHAEKGRSSAVGPDSAKEALDALPDAALFCAGDGRVLLKNYQADALGLSPLTPEGFLTDDDGRTWQVLRSELDISGAGVTEVIAADVTEEYALVDELEQRASRSREVNARLRAYGSDLVRLTREEEVLAMKARVHGETGRALVALRAYEAQDASGRDRLALVALWRRTLRLLEGAEQEDQPSSDEWGQLVEVAGAIGVRLVLEGELPHGGEAQKVALAVVHECLNNAVRHGGAHKVWATCSTRGGITELHVSNDGSVPSAPAEEHGGLANVRAMVERAGGTLEVEWRPRVAVTARFEVGVA